MELSKAPRPEIKTLQSPENFVEMTRYIIILWFDSTAILPGDHGVVKIYNLAEGDQSQVVVVKV